jgi:hypothetical protein
VADVPASPPSWDDEPAAGDDDEEQPALASRMLAPRKRWECMGAPV